MNIITIKTTLLLLLCAVALIPCIASEQSSSSSSSSTSSSSQQPQSSDNEPQISSASSSPQQQQQQQNDQLDEDDGSLQKSASEQFASYSNFDAPQEFGMRKTSFESHHHHNYHNNLHHQPVQHQQNGDYSSMSNSDSLWPHSIFGSNGIGAGNGGGSGSNSENSLMSNDFSISLDGHNNGQNGQQQQQQQGENQDMGSFTPVSLSVEEAFRKYFPTSGGITGKDQSMEGYSQQQQQQIQGQQSQQQQQSSSGYSPNNNENNQQVDPEKEVVNIDSLREIVEKQPLAKPNPFDPPSPPLSAFLPPPPNSQLVESNVVSPSANQYPHPPPPPQVSSIPSPSPPSSSPSSTISVEQYQPLDMDHVVGANQQQGVGVGNGASGFLGQFKPSESPSFLTQTNIGGGGGGPGTGSNGGGGTKFIYTKETMDHMDQGPSDNVESSFSDLGDDEEAYAYNTETLDDNGKKVVVYSRPVMPEIGGAKFESFASQMDSSGLSHDMMNPMYRKPSYEDEQKQQQQLQQGPPLPPSQQQQQQNLQHQNGPDFSVEYQGGRPFYHNQITIEKPGAMNDGMDGMYNGNGNGNNQMNDMRQSHGGPPPPPPPSIFPDFNDFESHGPPPPPPPTWNQQQQQNNQMRPMEHNYNHNNNNNQQFQHNQHQHNNNHHHNHRHNQRPSITGPPKTIADGPQNIEYGGFIPIKKPVVGGDMDERPPPPPQQQGQQGPRQQFGDQYVDHHQKQTQPPYEFAPSNQNQNEYQMHHSPPPPPREPQQGPPMHQMAPPPQSSGMGGGLNLNYESEYHGPGTFNNEPETEMFSSGDRPNDYMPPPPPRQQQQGPPPPGGQSGGPPNGPYGNNNGNNNKPPTDYLNKIQNIHVKPLYGNEAMKKLRELGINEDEFYGTVNKILQKSRNPMQQHPQQQQQQQQHPNKHHQFLDGPMMPTMPHHIQLPPYLNMPKANLYRSPPKNRPRPYQGGPNGGKNQGQSSMMFPPNNLIAEDFELKFLKDELPPGASYNPRDVGLDESVLAQIHLLDSGIGGYRFTPSHMAASTHHMPNHYHHHPYHGPGAGGIGGGMAGFRANLRNKIPYNKKMPKDAFAGVPPPQSPSSSAGQHSMIMPFVFPSPGIGIGTGAAAAAGAYHRRLPYSQTNTKGFYPVYGYRAAASELKPQFVLPSSPTSSSAASSSSSPTSSVASPSAAASISSSSSSPSVAPSSVSTASASAIASGSSSSSSRTPFKFLQSHHHHHPHPHPHHLHPHPHSLVETPSIPFSITGLDETAIQQQQQQQHQHAFSNIFGIRSIKGIKSLVSYLTGGVAG